MRRWFKAALQFMAFLIQVVATLALVLFCALVFWIAISTDARPKEAELVGVLAITIATVIIAAFFTAVIHKVISPDSEKVPPGEVFRESIKRYAWLAAPIASGYGIAQVITRVAEIIAQGK